MLEDLFVKGYHLDNNPLMFKYLKWYFKLPTYNYDGSRYPIIGGRGLLKKTRQLIADTYFSGLDYTMGECSGWTGIGSNTSVWHTDLVEGNNLAVLMYMTDLPKAVGGGLSIKNISYEDHHTIWPKKFDIVFMNQQECWLHRVEPMLSKTRRYVGHMEYNIKGY